MTSYPAIEFDQHNNSRCDGGCPVLQHCSDCAKVQYPSRELCRACLSSKLQWKPLEDSRAKVLANTQLHNSLDQYYRERRPWNLLSVQLELNSLGTLLVHSSEHRKPGDTVQLSMVRDNSGAAVLFAVAEGEDAKAIWQDLSQDKASNN